MQLGRYTILKQLASGSIADVLLARASGLEGFARHVVLKRIKPELAQEQRFTAAFLDEARISASLNHQNIVQVHDIGEQDGAYFFAMEYIHGEDVRTILAKVRERSEAVPLEIATAIITAAAAGLHHAHEKMNAQGEKLGIVHRDVAPSNILVGYDGSVKLVDFGLAKAAQRSTTTASGTLKGKASYMSPEQCKGENVDRRTDTFALGIVMYELVTAQRLFKGPTEYATMAAVVDGEIPPPSRARADVPPALDAIILRALARNVNERYQTAEAFREAIETFTVEYELRTSNKALADYLVRLFGQRREPWEVLAEDSRTPLTDDTLAGRGVAIPPPILPAKPTASATTVKSKTVARPGTAKDDDDDDGEFDVGEVATTVMRKSDEYPVQLPPRTDDAKTQVGGDDDADGDGDGEEFSTTVVEPVDFEAENDTVVGGDAGATMQDLAKPLGKRQPRTPMQAPNAAAAPPSQMAPPMTPMTPPVGGPRPISPAGAFRPAAPAPGSSSPPPGQNAPWTPVFPPAGAQAPPMPSPMSPMPPMAGPRSPQVNGAPSMFAQMSAQPVPNEFAYGGGPVPSLSRFAGLKSALKEYKRSILLGGGAGFAVVLVMIIVMKACGGSDEPAPAVAPPPDAAATQPQAAPVTTPGDAGTPDAAPKHPKHPPIRKGSTGSGSAR